MPHHQFIAAASGYEDKSIDWKDGHVWRRGKKIMPQAVIDDDLFYYMYDTFKWVRVQYPNGKLGNGFDPYGYSVIRDPKEIRRFQETAAAWRGLFRADPECITLTGRYSWDGGGEERDGYYEELNFRQLDLIEQMNNLIQVTEKALNDGTPSFTSVFEQ